MSYSIISKPQQIALNTSPIEYTSMMPLYNDIVYTVSSDNNIKCKYRYICEIYIRGNYITTIKLFPNIDGLGVFKINRVLEDYIEINNKSNIFGFDYDSNRILDYELKFGEEYDTSVNCDQIVTVYDNIITSGINYAFPAVMQYREWLYFALADDNSKYYMSTVNKGKFLSNQPDTILIGKGEQAELSFLVLPHSVNNHAKLQIKKYDINNNILGTIYITNPNTTVTDYTKIFQIVGVGVENINNYLGQLFINNNVFKYTICLTNSSNVQTSELKTYQIDRRKTIYDKYRFRWLNRLGAFDSYTYTLTSKVNTNIVKQSYSKLLGNYNINTGNYQYYIGDRSKTTSSVTSKDNYTVTSNWLTEKENEWLQELYTSPLVYLQQTNKIFEYYKMSGDFDIEENPIIIFNFNLPLSTDDINYIKDQQVFIDKSDYTYNSNISQLQSLDYNGNNIFYIPNVIGTIYNDCGEIYKYYNQVEQYPIDITTTSYETKTKLTTKNINQTINFEFAFDKNIQRL